MDEHTRDLQDALAEAQALARGEDTGGAWRFFPPDSIDAREARASVGVTQEQFAARYGFSVGAVQKWESGARKPDTAARTLLYMIARDHDAVDRMLGIKSPPKSERQPRLRS